MYNMRTIREICSVFLLCAGGLAGCINGENESNVNELDS